MTISVNIHMYQEKPIRYKKVHITGYYQIPLVWYNINLICCLPQNMSLLFRYMSNSILHSILTDISKQLIFSFKAHLCTFDINFFAFSFCFIMIHITRAESDLCKKCSRERYVSQCQIFLGITAAIYWYIGIPLQHVSFSQNVFALWQY